MTQKTDKTSADREAARQPGPTQPGELGPDGQPVTNPDGTPAERPADQDRKV